MVANSNEDRKGSDRAQTEHAKDETDRRFNETVRNLLNTPHKPHKGGEDSQARQSETFFRSGRRVKGLDLQKPA